MSVDPSRPFAANVSVEAIPANRGGAKALLLTVLGEFVLPSGGAVWTTTLVSAAAALGIGEKNARQAIARIGEQGLIAGERHGRRVRWSLTPVGRELFEPGAQRIYQFGTGSVDWGGEWLMVHCPVSEQQRMLRSQLRTKLRFLGFGELSASLLVSPHVDREGQLRGVLRELDLEPDTLVLRSVTGGPEADRDLVGRAWDLAGLELSYRSFSQAWDQPRPAGSRESFCRLVNLVHDWRRFPFVDPELPTDLLPKSWAGHLAAGQFHGLRADWSSAAQAWFAALEAD